MQISIKRALEKIGKPKIASQVQALKIQQNYKKKFYDSSGNES
jgi:hypothetical protein